MFHKQLNILYLIHKQYSIKWIPHINGLRPGSWHYSYHHHNRFKIDLVTDNMVVNTCDWSISTDFQFNLNNQTKAFGSFKVMLCMQSFFFFLQKSILFGGVSFCFVFSFFFCEIYLSLYLKTCVFNLFCFSSRTQYTLSMYVKMFVITISCLV